MNYNKMVENIQKFKDYDSYFQYMKDHYNSFLTEDERGGESIWASEYKLFRKGYTPVKLKAGSTQINAPSPMSWCDTMFGNKWVWNGTSFYFLHEEDKLLFKIRWGDYVSEGL